MIAAIEPETGEWFLGKNVIDAFTTLTERGKDGEESVASDIRTKDGFDFYGKYRRMLSGRVITVYVSPGHRIGSINVGKD